MSDNLAGLLPGLPDGHDHGGDGYDWADRLTGGWYAVASWGADGWDLGDWPYVIVVHYDAADGGLFGRALYCEGDLSAEGYTTREERDAATGRTAVFYWRRNGRGPAGLPAEGPVPHYGPYPALALW